MEELTEREKRIRNLVKKGKTIEEISSETGLSRADVQLIVMKSKKISSAAARKSKPKKFEKLEKVVVDEEKVKEKKVETGTVFVEKRRDGEGLFLQTDIDRLLELIKKNRSLSIEDAANYFKVIEGKIEEWGHILESHDLIEMHYPPFGKPIMRVKGFEGKGRKFKIPKTEKYEERKPIVKKEHIKKPAVKPFAEKYKYKKPRSRKIFIIPIILIVFCVVFIFLFFTNKKLLDDLTQYLFAAINTLGDYLNTFLILISSNQIYLLITIIIIVVVVLLIVLKISWKRIKFWWWKRKVMH